MAESIIAPARFIYDSTPLMLQGGFGQPVEEDFELAGFFSDADLDDIGGADMFMPAGGITHTTDFGKPQAR